MKADPLKPRYTAKPIRSLSALAKALGCDSDFLIAIANRAEQFYKSGPQIPKPDGKVRETLCATHPLRDIQSKIQSRILKKFFFPDYLTGSLPGCDQKRNAARHVGSAVLLTEDIRNFFPSASALTVKSIFRELAGFSEDVSDCLTKLVLKQPGLPQGASTSPALANLLLWKTEPALVAALQARGMVYTRFVDDISVSSQERISSADKTWVVSKVYGLLHRSGFKPHRKKHALFTSGGRMVTTKLTTNTKPGIIVEDRAKTRAAVHEQKNIPAEKHRSTLASVLGRVHRLKQFHPGAGLKLKQALLG